MLSDNRSQQTPIIDRETAIKNLGGMVWLYEKHLTKFRTAYADSTIKLDDYLARGKTDEARILIHTVKGLAGTLGLRQLYYAAADLEKSILTSDPSLYFTLRIYDSCLKEFLQTSLKD